MPEAYRKHSLITPWLVIHLTSAANYQRKMGYDVCKNRQSLMNIVESLNKMKKNSCEKSSETVCVQNVTMNLEHLL